MMQYQQEVRNTRTSNETMHSEVPDRFFADMKALVDKEEEPNTKTFF